MRTVCSYILALAVGILIFPALFHTAILESYPILFYRGIAIAVVCAVVQFLAVRALLSLKLPLFSLDYRDIVCVCALAFSFNITFLIVFPVTFERSVSTFLLSQLEAASQQGLTLEQMENIFKEDYVSRKSAVERRMKEQIITGNVTQVGDRYFLSPRGRSFMLGKVLIERLYSIKTEP